MRTPTPLADAFAWHRNVLAGVNVDLDGETPECGYFKRRLVKNGPFVPARFWLVQEVDEDGLLVAPELLQAECNGQYSDPEDLWPWVCGNPISEQEFKYMEALRHHVAFHEPDHPAANPRSPVDWLKVPTPSFT